MQKWSTIWRSSSPLAQHQEWMHRLATIDPASVTAKSAFQVMFEARPSDANIGVPLRRAAWDTAVSTGALKLLDYDVATAMSEIYGYQDVMSTNVGRLAQSVIYTPSTFDPASRDVSVQVMRWLVTEVEGNERYLRDLYKQHLPLLRRAASES